MRLARTHSTLSILKSVFALVLLVSVLTPLASASWWNGEWTLRRKVTIDTSATGIPLAEDLSNIPVVVRLSDANFHFASAQQDGSDLRFVAEDDKTLLPYHLEKFDTVLNEAIVWVKLPSVKAASKTSFWLYYGNASGKAAKVESAKDSFDEKTVLVYHFNEKGLPPQDFTMGGANATTGAALSEGAQVGPGVRFDGRAVVTIPEASNLAWNPGAAFALSLWVKPAIAQSNGVLFSRGARGTDFALGLANGAPYLMAGGRRSQAAATPLTTSWHQVSAVSNGSQILLYVDGELATSLASAVPAVQGGALLGSNFQGELDEFSWSKGERSAAYVKFLSATQGADGAKILSLGEDEQDSGFFSALKGGYVGIILGSLTVDGWVVIVILVLMSLVSWAVMVRKAGYLNKIAKGNEQFLEAWSHVASDLSVLDSGDTEHVNSLGGNTDLKALRHSSLYRVYHIGVEEIRHRLAADGQQGGSKVLSSRSIQAIRAALDGKLVRESAKLNEGMVLLTIAISGGPFLGLLGTVVGVMITFAAVAAAGDVNVNAIAPGIAAALAATVAGLAVAIPALFGYNYLLTRIKGASNDMHIFIDEFVAKLAEFYSDEVTVGGHDDDDGHH